MEKTPAGTKIRFNCTLKIEYRKNLSKDKYRPMLSSTVELWQCEAGAKAVNGVGKKNNVYKNCVFIFAGEQEFGIRYP